MSLIIFFLFSKAQLFSCCCNDSACCCDVRLLWNNIFQERFLCYSPKTIERNKRGNNFGVRMIICNFVIVLGKPYNSFSPMNVFFIFLVFNSFRLSTSIFEKEKVEFWCWFRVFFALVTMYLVYSYTFRDTEVGVILFQYGDDYVFAYVQLNDPYFSKFFCLV